MKIKIIDLLVKISKGEKPPKHIKYNNLNLYWNDEYCTYDIKEKKMYAPFYMFDYSELNNEVEIIEENKKTDFEPIEELTCNEYDFESKTINSLIKNQRKLIEEINKLKEEIR